MKKSVHLVPPTLLFLFYFSLNLHPVVCQETRCSFHLCTPERLGCSNNRLMIDHLGCQLCRCEEDLVLNRPCALHGCTADLLGCASGLRRSSDGCTLCECNDPGLSETTSGGNSSCLPPQCLGLECESLRVDPVTGCSICECQTETSNLDISNLGTGDSCPHSRELLDDIRMTRGINKIVQGSNVPKFKLSFGKLRKGFIPGQKYKIVLKATNSNCPFKEFLFEVSKADHSTLPYKGKRMHKRNPASTMIRGMERSSNVECDAGYLEESTNASFKHARVVPHCRNAAVERDEVSNKTMAFVDWIAPACGCVYIRASVVDFTGTHAYLYDDDLISTRAGATSDLATPPSGKINRSLYRTVCAKATYLSKKKKTSLRAKKQKGGMNWLFKECCKAAASRKRQNNRRIICERDSKIYSLKRFYRYTGLRRNCKSAYKTCCREFGSSSRDQGSVSGEIDTSGDALESANSHQSPRTGSHTTLNSEVSKKVRRRRKKQRMRMKKHKKIRQRTSRRRRY